MSYRRAFSGPICRGGWPRGPRRRALVGRVDRVGVDRYPARHLGLEFLALGGQMGGASADQNGAERHLADGAQHARESCGHRLIMPPRRPASGWCFRHRRSSPRCSRRRSSASVQPGSDSSARVSTLFGFGVWGLLLRQYDSSAVAPFSLLVPVFGMSAAALFLGERLSPLSIGGGRVRRCGFRSPVADLNPHREGRSGRLE
jgi:hypothetical protein